MNAATTIHTTETNSPSQTEAFAKSIGAALKPTDLLLLDGELGAGKTCFTRGIAQGIGADPAAVSSPTYVVAHEYPAQAFTLIHVDAYRLFEGDDLEDIIGIATDSDTTAMVIEWPSRLWTDFPEHALHITIEHAGESHRRITITGNQQWATRLQSL